MLVFHEQVLQELSMDVLTDVFALAQREAQVRLWVAKGKTNRDIGLILNMSPRTVNKHLEHIYIKLGVETGTAAANKVMRSVNWVLLSQTIHTATGTYGRQGSGFFRRRRDLYYFLDGR